MLSEVFQRKFEFKVSLRVSSLVLIEIAIKRS